MFYLANDFKFIESHRTAFNKLGACCLDSDDMCKYFACPGLVQGTVTIKNFHETKKETLKAHKHQS